MSSIRRIFILATGAAALGVASVASAGVAGGLLQQVQERNARSESAQSNPAPASAPVYSAPPAPSYSPPPVQRAPEPRENIRNVDPRRTAQPSARPREQAQQRPDRPSESRSSNARGGQRGVIGNVLERRFPDSVPGNGNGNGNGGGHGNHGDHDHDGNHQRPPRVVYVLPPVYNDYYWNGSRYYNFDGGWYSPYGGSYVSVGTPYGLFVRSLPGYSSSFYYGDTRYYYYDDTYYTYEPNRGGYVVSPSPYDDGEDSYDDAADEDLYIYPAQAQSEQQQADDRYACHRWAVKESGYDPIDAEYDRDRRAGYLRAITACLTGRGYSVK